MATAASLLLLFATVLSLSVSTSARPGRPFHPCNTLLISYSFTSFSESSDGSFDGSLTARQPSTFITVYRIISPFHVSRHLPHHSHLHPPILSQRRVTPLASSLQDRARDILAVAAGLLFGVGCGALTAATLYFLFAVATNRHVIIGGSHYDDEEDEYDEIPSPKKGAYVAVPVAESKVATKDGWDPQNPLLTKKSQPFKLIWTVQINYGSRFELQVICPKGPFANYWFRPASEDHQENLVISEQQNCTDITGAVESFCQILLAQKINSNVVAQITI